MQVLVRHSGDRTHAPHSSAHIRGRRGGRAGGRARLFHRSAAMPGPGSPASRCKSRRRYRLSFGIVVEDVRKMAMLFVVVEVQHLVGVLQSLGELARPTVANAGKCVSRDQQVGVAGRLRDVQHLLRPWQGLRYAPLRTDVGRQSPEDGQPARRGARATSPRQGPDAGWSRLPERPSL